MATIDSDLQVLYALDDLTDHPEGIYMPEVNTAYTFLRDKEAQHPDVVMQHIYLHEAAHGAKSDREEAWRQLEEAIVQKMAYRYTLGDRQDEPEKQAQLVETFKNHRYNQAEALLESLQRFIPEESFYEAFFKGGENRDQLEMTINQVYGDGAWNLFSTYEKDTWTVNEEAIANITYPNIITLAQNPRECQAYLAFTQGSPRNPVPDVNRELLDPILSEQIVSRLSLLIDDFHFHSLREQRGSLPEGSTLERMQKQIPPALVDLINDNGVIISAAEFTMRHPEELRNVAHLYLAYFHATPGA